MLRRLLRAVRPPVAALLPAPGGLLAAAFLLSAPAAAAGRSSGDFRIEILVDGQPVRQYAPAASRRDDDAARPRYVEAIKGKEYAIRIHNPLGVRVAVALSVDGLNTIDARHTAARDARKWVLDPHETMTISGWQMSLREARRFYFTSEEASYAARLGQRENLGIISAVFFRERPAVRLIPLQISPPGGRERPQAPAAPEGKRAPSPAGEAQGAGSPGPAAKRSEAPAYPPAAADAVGQVKAEEYAATGIGDRTTHLVRQIHMDIEDVPAASVNVRYEYRAQLARLGIVPERGDGEILSRRDRARGFAGGFCPDIK